jgi:hypothetical protein
LDGQWVAAFAELANQTVTSAGGAERLWRAMSEPELDVPVLAPSPLSRAVERRIDKRPQLSDPRLGTVEQDTDVVMFVHRATAILEGHRAGMVEFDVLYAPALLDDLPDRT